MKNLEPNIVWRHFYDITRIPRPSKREEKIRAFIINFGKSLDLTTLVDQTGNVLIRKPATIGYEDKKTIILQAHMDMVCEKNSGVEHDFDNDPIETIIEDGWLKAKGTTLGADNGIGMALMMSVLSSKEVKHPTLECLFTTDEETGLTGAFGLDENLLKGDILINLDSEDDGEVFVGCAGGIDTTITYQYKPEKTPKDYFTFAINVSGLLGGHSGDDINKNRANANKILNRILWNMRQEMDLRLVDLSGGNLHNAIPREAQAVACVPYNKKESVRISFNNTIADIQSEIGDTETQLKIALQSREIAKMVFSDQDTDHLLDAIYATPNGVIAMSRDIEGLVETSTNLASIKTENYAVRIVTSQRSSVESAKYTIANQIETIYKLAGAIVTHGDGYPGWAPNLNSQILKIAEKTYKQLFGTMPKVKAIHAGLECGLFLKKYPHLDMISIGPTMRGVHSPDERMEIATVDKAWKWLVEILTTA